MRVLTRNDAIMPQGGTVKITGAEIELPSGERVEIRGNPDGTVTIPDNVIVHRLNTEVSTVSGSLAYSIGADGLNPDSISGPKERGK